MAMKRKRNGGNNFAFGNKRRRRFIGRRRVTRRGGSKFNSAQDGRPVSVGFRSKRLRPKAYRRALWRDTLFKAHYRSLFDFVRTQTMPATTTTCKIGFAPAHGDVPFYTSGGGLLTIDSGVTVPQFQDDITIRGGYGSITFTNLDANDAIRVRLFGVRSISNPAFSILPADDSDVLLSASTIDPSIIPDFSAFGRVTKSFDLLLMPGQRPITFFQKLPVQKVDQNVWENRGGNRFWWMWFASQTSNVDTVNNTLRIQISHNLSFSGDAVSPATLTSVDRPNSIMSLLTSGRPGSSITPGLVRPST